jgi:nucleoid DNA-binding protein
MTKTEVEAALAQQLHINKESAKDVLNAILDEITLALSRGKPVALAGFGTFVVTDHAERQGRNPQTGEAMTVPAGKRVHFRAGKAFKNAIVQP